MMGVCMANFFFSHRHWQLLCIRVWKLQIISSPPCAARTCCLLFGFNDRQKIENRSKPQFAKLFWLCDLQRFELPIFCSGSFSGVVLCDDGEEEGSPMEGRGSCENILRDNSTFHIHSLPYPFLCVDWRSVEGET